MHFVVSAALANYEPHKLIIIDKYLPYSLSR